MVSTFIEHKKWLRPCFAVWALGIVLATAPPGFAFGEPILPPSGDPWAVGDAEGGAIYRSCASCHLANGGGRPDGAIPRLAGQRFEILVGKLEKLRSGEVFLPVMSAFANSLAPHEVTAVAAYLAALPTPASMGAGSLNATSKSKKAAGHGLYSQSCAACHGMQAEGNLTLSAPRLCGQHSGYIERRVAEVMRGARADSDPAMAAIARSLAPAEIAAIAEFLAYGKCEAPVEGEP